MQVDDRVRHSNSRVVGPSWDTTMPHRNRASRATRARADYTVVKSKSELSPATSDSGFSLVEIVCSISLIGIVVIPLMQATFASITASSTSREIAEIETVLQNAADRVNRAPIGCDYDIYVEAAALSKGWEATVALSLIHI